MASVKENRNSDGQIISYRWRTCIGRDQVTGNQVFVTKTVPAPVGLTPANAKKEMQHQAYEWEKKVKKGDVPVKDITFKTFIERDFIPIHVCKAEHSPSTRVFYKDICTVLVEKFGKRPLDKIRSIDVDRFLRELENEVRIDKHGKEKHLSSTRIKAFRTVLVVAFGFAEKKHLIEKNPMREVDPIKTGKITVDFMNQDEIKKFLKKLDDEINNARDNQKWEKRFWKTAMYVLIFCGLRRGELAGLQWGDIDLSKRCLMVQRNVIRNYETNGNLIKKPKSDDSSRPVPIPLTAYTALMEWKAEQENQYGLLLPTAFVFGSQVDPYSPIRPDDITRWLGRFEKRNGLRKVSPHDLRHTCGTSLLQSGATTKEVQMILGHADASTTLKYYCGIDSDKLKEAGDRLDSYYAVGE